MEIDKKWMVRIWTVEWCKGQMWLCMRRMVVIAMVWKCDTWIWWCVWQEIVVLVNVMCDSCKGNGTCGSGGVLGLSSGITAVGCRCRLPMQTLFCSAAISFSALLLPGMETAKY